MALEPGKQDRSYQFGRLLAVMEKVERDTYTDNENREPNAIRQMPRQLDTTEDDVREEVAADYAPKMEL